jgi:hypothetical protein
MNRDELIQLAAETLDCDGKTAHNHWIYREAQTGVWVVDDHSMETLGRLMTEYDEVLGHHIWCERSTATEVDVDSYVREWDIDGSTDLGALMAELRGATAVSWMTGLGPKPELVLYLLLRFFRQDVVDTIRINAEIDRDHDAPEPDGPDWDEDDSFDWSDDGEATR